MTKANFFGSSVKALRELPKMVMYLTVQACHERDCQRTPSAGQLLLPFLWPVPPVVTIGLTTVRDQSLYWLRTSPLTCATAYEIGSYNLLQTCCSCRNQPSLAALPVCNRSQHLCDWAHVTIEKSAVSNSCQSGKIRLKNWKKYF